jgi:hypothetical protein
MGYFALYQWTTDSWRSKFDTYSRGDAFCLASPCDEYFELMCRYDSSSPMQQAVQVWKDGPKAWTNLNWPGSEYQRLSPLPDVASLSLHSWAWAFASPMRKNWTRLQHGLKIGVRLCESRKIRAGSVFRPRGNYCRYIEIASTPPFSWKWGTTKCLWFIIIFPSTFHHFRGVQTIFRCTRMVKPCWILMTSQSDSGPFFLSAKKGSWYFGVFLHSCLMFEWWLNGG